MAFEEISFLQTSKFNPSGLPVSMARTKRKTATVPSLQIGMTKDFFAKTGLAHNERFRLLVGAGDDAGVMKLIRDRSGPLTLVANELGGARLHCGKTDRFGTDAQEKTFCAAEVIHNGEIEITLPFWALQD